MSKQRVHLIANAHLDPVWLWNWEEGAAEALSTFRSAAQIAEQTPDFIFNHNEALLYEWIEEYDPALLERIRTLVKAGKWSVMGGWYLQPDCNMPSGESLVRQILIGRKYFEKFFGKRPKTAINFDPFGHSVGLVQILAKSGFDNYLICRPDEKFLKLPGDVFWWEGVDGSRVLCRRAGELYNSHVGRVKEKIDICLKNADPSLPACALWGVGNHGGGPSREDIATLENLKRTDDQRDFVHSTPDNYFDDLREAEADYPVFRGEVGRWAVGCYTSAIRIKQKHRALENALFVAEKIGSTAAALSGMSYPREALSEALRDLMFSEFHDILPGSCIASAEENSLRLIDHGLEIASRVTTRAFFSLARSEAPAKPDNIAIFAYNPHPWTLFWPIDCEFQLPYQNWGPEFVDVDVKQGETTLPHQFGKEESNVPIDWRKRVIFRAELRPMALTRFDVLLKKVPTDTRKPAFEINRNFAFRTSRYEVQIRAADGRLDFKEIDDHGILCQGGAALTIVDDSYESWGSTITRFGNNLGEFALLSAEEAAKFAGVEQSTFHPLRVIEDGPVRTVVEALMGWGDSRAVVHYAVMRDLPWIGVDVKVNWRESNRCLKLSFPMGFDSNLFETQSAFSNHIMPMDGTECAQQKYCLVSDTRKNVAMGVINDGVYGCDYREGSMRATLLRSPAYSAHDLENRKVLRDDRFTSRMEQGERSYRFWLFGGDAHRVRREIDSLAASCNERPLAITMSPGGSGNSLPSFITASNHQIVLTALKVMESTNDWILRAFNPIGEAQVCEFVFANKALTVHGRFAPFEIKTWRVNFNEGLAEESNLIEEPMQTEGVGIKSSEERQCLIP